MQRVRSIISSGTQYIDTGFVPDQDTRVVMTAAFHVQDTAAWLFGSRESVNNKAFGFLTYTNTYRADYHQSTISFASTVSFTDPFQIDMNKNVVTLNSLEPKKFSNETFASTCPLCLFANNNGGAISGHAAAEMFGCQIYDNGTLVRDYVPCLDDNGAACLYDQVNGTYAHNAGTGSFAVRYPPVMFRRRTRVESNGPVAVTITGTGDSSNCYATINGTKYTSAASGIEVVAGDVITFAVYGYSNTMKGIITIDGTQVVSVTRRKTETYDWTVPEGIETISISLSYINLGTARRGQITVTTA